MLFSIVDTSFIGILSAFVVILLLYCCCGGGSIDRRLTNRKQRERLAVFITGCDSGMGEVTATHLASLGYRVYAGAYLKATVEAYEDDQITGVQIDVTNPESVAAAADFVAKDLQRLGTKRTDGLFAVIQCAGIAVVGPAEYLPLDYFRRAMDVNLFGYVNVAQSFLPLLKQRTEGPRGCMIFTSSGGLPGPAPPLLTAYMASKWGGEAFAQGLRLELRLAQVPVDAVVFSPGFTKPTRLFPEGQSILAKLWSSMPDRARSEYQGMIDAFISFCLHDNPATHVNNVGPAMANTLALATRPLRFYLGFDARAGLIVGLLPTRLREIILRNSMFAKFKGPPRFL